MNRRNFLGASVGLSLAAMIPQSLTAAVRKTPSAKKKPKGIIKPARLKEGDTVGLIAPAWLITEEQLNNSVTRLKDLFGLKAVYNKDRILGSYGCFSNTDAERAADINEMFQNPEVNGILCVKGGYGCARILDMIDYDAIRKNPKVIQGFSDVTALLNAIHQQTGLITFHGPVGITIHREYNAREFRSVVMNPQDSHTIVNDESDLVKALTDTVYQRYTIVSGEATGRLAGGNLVLISAAQGTNMEVDLKDKIVCIEETGEEPYRIDRMLTQLIGSGKLQQAAGIAFGVLDDCERNEKSIAPNSFTLREVIEDRIKPLNIPAAYGLSFGHVLHNCTLPIGIKAHFNADTQQLQLLESAVA